jgi:hypothetical protein
MSRYGASRAELLDVFRCFFLNDVDDVVDRHDALDAIFGIHDGKRHEIVFLKYATHGLLILIRAHPEDFRVHHVSHPSARLRRKELPERHHTQKLLVLVQNVNVIERLELPARLLPQVSNRLIHRHVRSDTREPRAHQPARCVLLVGEECVHLFFRRLVEQRK